ncbi:hypothetical protein SUDANB43_07371 [Streptomyces sp. enrichment culture]
MEEIPRAAVTVCRLRADRKVLRQRLTGRGGPAEVVDEMLWEAEVLDASTFADACVDTSGLRVDEVVRRVGERTGGWPVPAFGRPADASEPSVVAAGHGNPRPARAEPSARPPVLWLCGTTGVGKSAVGFEAYRRVLGAGATAACLDLDQLGWCGPVPGGPANHGVKAGPQSGRRVSDLPRGRGPVPRRVRPGRGRGHGPGVLRSGACGRVHPGPTARRTPALGGTHHLPRSRRQLDSTGRPSTGSARRTPPARRRPSGGGGRGHGRRRDR